MFPFSRFHSLTCHSSFHTSVFNPPLHLCSHVLVLLTSQWPKRARQAELEPPQSTGTRDKLSTLIPSQECILIHLPICLLLTVFLMLCYCEICLKEHLWPEIFAPAPPLTSFLTFDLEQIFYPLCLRFLRCKEDTTISTSQGCCRESNETKTAEYLEQLAIEASDLLKVTKLVLNWYNSRSM